MNKTLRGVLIGFGVLVAAALTLHFAFPAAEVDLGRSVEHHLAGLDQKSIAVGGMNIAYLEGGSGEPLLLVHGFGADKDNWTRVSRHLTPKFHVFAIDLPGFGESSRSAEWNYRIQDQVERVHQIAGALGLTRFHMGGSSMGGHITATYAARFPNEVASIWLLDPGGVSTAEPSEAAQQIAAGGPVPLLAHNEAEFDTLLSWMFVTPPFIPAGFKKVLAQRAVANVELNTRIFRQIRSESIPLENLVGGLPIPAHIVWGENDRVLSPSGAKILASLMPKSSVTIFPKTGHLPMIEHPKQTADDYLNFRSTIAAAAPTGT